MLRLVSSIVTVSLAVLAPALGAQSADAALDRAIAAYGKMHTFHATFEQQLTNPLTGSTMVAQGEVHRQKPNLISVRFTDPAGDRVVIDGSAIWLYMPSTNPGQAFKMPLGNGAAGTFDPAQLLERPRQRFDITDGGVTTIGERQAHLVTLVPKNGDAPFTTAKLWIDAEGLVRQFEVVEESGMTRRIRILSLHPNASVPASTFRFTPPAGVTVVDRSGG